MGHSTDTRTQKTNKYNEKNNENKIAKNLLTSAQSQEGLGTLTFHKQENRGRQRLRNLPGCPSVLLPWRSTGCVAQSDPQILTCTAMSEPLPSTWPSPAPVTFLSQVTSKESPNEPSPYNAAAQGVGRTQGSPESLPCLPPLSLACPSLKGGCHVARTQDGLGAWDISSSHVGVCTMSLASWNLSCRQDFGLPISNLSADCDDSFTFFFPIDFFS